MIELSEFWEGFGYGVLSFAAVWLTVFWITEPSIRKARKWKPARRDVASREGFVERATLDRLQGLDPKWRQRL